MLVSSARVIVPGLVALGVLFGCSDSTGLGSSPTAPGCSGTALTTLTPGAHLLIDPAATGGCVRLPAAGASGARHLLMAFSGTGEVTDNGLEAPYLFSGQGAALAASALAASAQPAIRGARRAPPPAQRFHDMRRARGRELAAAGIAVRPPQRPNLAVAPPSVGSTRSFQVCSDENCTSFASVTATLQHVGPHGLLYLDNASPSNGYTPSDISRLGSLFDSFMYPIDTTAFGRESDIDGNGAVIILLSPAVNQVSGNCNTSQSVTLGFFFPGDLLPGSQGSNGGEIFYGIVPDPASRTCTISHSFAMLGIAPTFLHEFQHMISFGRHVLLANGISEDSWLDEGLSRLAEELGGREIPDQFCSPDRCASTFPAGDVNNAFEYLQKDTLEANPLIEPANAADGSLPEDGANWLFVRWLADHFSADTVLGTSLTRALDGADSPSGTELTGSANVTAVTQGDFPALVGEWQLANFLTAVSGFTEPTGRLHYFTWDLASLFTTNFGAYPLQPDSLVTGSYSHTGVLRPGSGRHLLVIQPASSPEVDVQLAAPGSGGVDATLVPRIAVARVQ